MNGNYDLVSVICFSFVATCGIFAASTYALAKLFLTGKAFVFEKRDDAEPERKIHVIGNR